MEGAELRRLIMDKWTERKPLARKFEIFAMLFCASVFQLTLLCDDFRNSPAATWIDGGADGKVHFHGPDPDAPWIAGAPDG